MHVHVDFLAIAIEEQQRERKTRRRHQIVVRARKRVQKQTVSNKAPVDEYENRIPVVLLHLRTRNETADGKNPGGLIGVFHLQRGAALAEIDEIFEQLAAENLKYAFA